MHISLSMYVYIYRERERGRERERERDTHVCTSNVSSCLESLLSDVMSSHLQPFS